jgi:hypothetical protein
LGNRPSEELVDDDTAYVSVRNEHVIKAFDIGGGEPRPFGLAEANFEPDTLSLTNDTRTLVVGLRRNPAGSSARMAFIDVEAINDLPVIAPTYVTLPGVITGHQWLSSNGHVTYMALEGRVATPTTPGIPDRSRSSTIDATAADHLHLSEPEHQAARGVLRAAATAGLGSWERLTPELNSVESPSAR